MPTQFAANHVKVVTEAGVVYLMGLVTQTEANAAVEIARTTGGVQKVVRVFEIISDDAANVRQVIRRAERDPAPAFEAKLCAPADLAARMRRACRAHWCSPMAVSTFCIAVMSPTSRRRARSARA